MMPGVYIDSVFLSAIIATNFQASGPTSHDGLHAQLVYETFCSLDAWHETEPVHIVPYPSSSLGIPKSTKTFVLA